VAVFVANEQDLPVDEVRLSTLARHTLVSEEVEEVELSVLLVTSEHMKQLNSRFAGNDYATDVLAFPMMEEDESATILGDVVICPEVAQSNAAQAGNDFGREMDALVVHGTLHLLGYDHQNDSDRARMNARQERVLNSFRAARA
jgi:probable rRNA maturation factor